MGHLTRLSTRTTATAAGILLLAGGATGPALAAAPAEPAADQPVSVDCPNNSPRDTLRQAAPQFPEPFGPNVPNASGWDIEGADTSTFNGCKELSWISVTVPGATASSPETIALFHSGIYIGTTSATNFGFEPQVERVDDSTIRVTYRYPLEGDANGAPRGRAVSEFHYDDAAGSVVHTGEFPRQ